MLLRIFLFIIGVLISSLSLMFLILYSNLFNMGYNFFEYLNFISKRIECLMLFIGILLIIVSMYKRKEKNNDFYL